MWYYTEKKTKAIGAFDFLLFDMLLLQNFLCQKKRGFLSLINVILYRKQYSSVSVRGGKLFCALVSKRNIHSLKHS